MPIINPWLFYLADISSTTRDITLTIGIIIFILFIVITFSFHIDGANGKAKRAHKYIIIGGVIVFIGLLFPKEETCYKMMVASLVTTENIQTMGETATNVVDYIVDSIDQLLEEDEESK